MDTQQFAKAIRNQPCSVVDPRFGTYHNVQFTAQNDGWTQLYHARPGIPLAYYRQRFESLRAIPLRHLYDLRKDRSKTTEQVEEWEARHPGAGLIILQRPIGGSIHAAQKATRIKAIAYMKGLPGRDSLATNIGPHGSINLCIKHPDKMSDEQWLGVWEILNYRLGAIRAAEILAYRLGLRVIRAFE